MNGGKSVIRPFLLFALIIWGIDIFAQTTGLIYEPSTGTVLDPNGDGYISANGQAFSTDGDDTDEFEGAGWTRFPTVGLGEKLSDIRSGPEEGFTDFSVDPNGYATYMRIDGSNIIFRFRLADFRPNAKGYTVLIDTDGLIGTEDSDTYVDGENPGFELGVLLKSKHGVYIIDFDASSGDGSCDAIEYSYALEDNHQKSISGIESGGDLDAFYDFYVPLADLYAAGGISGTTGLRFAATTNTSNSCTFQGSISDIGGMDDDGNPCLFCALKELVNVQTPTSISDIQTGGLPTACPTIDTEIQAGSSINVTGVASLGSTVRLYINGSLDVITTADAATGIYTATLTSITAGDIVSATAEDVNAALKESNANCNNILVTNSCTTGKLDFSVYDPGGNKQIIGETTSGLSTTPILEVYDFTTGSLGVQLTGVFTYTSLDGTWEFVGDANFDKCQSIAVRIRADVNSCWSDYSYLCARSNGCSSQSDETGASIISPLASATTISGTAPNVAEGGTVHLFASSGLDANSSPIITSYIGNAIVSSGNWTVNIASGTVGNYACSDLTAYFYESGSCMSLPVFGTVLGASTSDVPVVSGTYCDPVNIIYGTSTEEEGTIVDVMVNGSSIGNTTVNQFGTWTLGELNILSGSITATAQNSGNCETQSAQSTPVVISSSPSAPAISWPAVVDEGATSITVTGGTGAQILFIDGSPLTDSNDIPFTSTTGTFSGLSAVGIPESYIYAGGQLSIVQSNGTCTSPESNTIEVACTSPDGSLTVSPSSTTIASGSTVDVTISGSEIFTFYQLYDTNLGSNSGIAGIGNGGDIVLRSSQITANTTLEIIAKRIFPRSCSTTLVNTTQVTIGMVTPSIFFNTTSSSGDESVNSADLQVDLSSTYGLDVTVDYTLTGTATGGGTDYTLANGTLTIPAGSTSENITIAGIIDDLLNEADETVIVTLSNPTNATLGTNTVHTYTIQDNDVIPTISFTSTSSSGDESINSADLQVDLSSTYGLDVTVDYAVTGTATGGGTDYTLANGTLTIPAGSTSENITIAGIIDDLLVEADETVIVTLSNPTNATLGSNAVHTYTIQDNDVIHTISFTSTSSSGDESVNSADLQVDLSAAYGLDVTVDYTLTGTATGGGTDYTLSSGTLTFPAGSTSENITIVGIIDDLLDETDETVIVTLSNPTNATLGSNAVHTYTIQDNDVIPTISFTSTSSSGDESVNSADLQMDLSAAYGLDVTVDYTLTGTATGGGTDYTLSSGTLTFPAGSTSENITIVGIIDDLLDETDETVIVTLSNPTNATLGSNTVHTYTILDNDVIPTISFTSTSSSADESVNLADLQVDLSAAYGLDVTVDYAVTGTASGGGTDYTLVNGTLTIPAGSTSENITISNIIDDLLDEADETVIVTLSNPTNATLGTNTVHTYTIQDNDVIPTISFTSTSSSGDESVNSADLQVDLSSTYGLEVTVDYAVTGTASGGGTDYTLANGTLTIPAGSTSENITIAGIIDDLLVEADETVIVTLSNPTNATLGSNTVHIYTIINDDYSPVLSVGDASIPEGTAAVLTASSTDANTGDTKEFSLSGTDALLFNIDPSTGELTFLSMPDYENPADDNKDNIYVIDVIVTDGGGNTDMQSITVTVTGINDNNPVLVVSDETVNEGNTFVETVSVTDLDVPDAHTFGLEGSDAALFDIDQTTGDLSFIVAPDFENPTDNGLDNIYNLEVVVIDEGGNSDVKSIAVTVVGINDNYPVLIAASNVLIPEGSANVITALASDLDVGDSKTFSISGTDASFFDIDPATGVLTFKSPPDFENALDDGTDNIYNLVIEVVDGAGNSDSQAIQVTITPVNDNDPIISANDAIVEAGSVYVQTVGVTDGDDLDKHTFSISGIDVDFFNIDPATGELTFKSAPKFDDPQDSNRDNIYEITVAVNDEAGNIDRQSIQVTVDGVSNGSPVAGDDEFTIDEGGSINGFSLLSNDSDPDNDNLIINTVPIVNVSHGNLLLQPNGTFTYIPDTDFFGTDSFSYEVCDQRGACAVASVTIIINEVNTDFDNDGIPNDIEGNIDTDGDGIPDNEDTDSDNDGILDELEGNTDTDNDGIPDYKDEDSDNDGIPDNEEGDKDTDGDGIPDFQDQDADNDGIPDSEELGGDRFADCDGDGIPNYLDNTRCGVMASKGYSPNGDGENDFWLVEGIKSFPNNNVKVFNRWGNIIFQREGYDNEEVVWFGQSEGALILGESEVPDGTYFYVIDLGNGDDPLSGYIVLKR